MIRRLLPALLLLAACAPHGTATPSGGQLEVGVELEGTGASPRVGDLAILVFRIHNGCDNPVILRDLTQPRDLMLAGSTDAVLTWQFSQPGLLNYLPDRDEWTYEKGRHADVRRPVFNSGFLVSGEDLTVRARVRLLEMPMDFQFSYFEIAPDDLRRKVYFEDRADKVLRYRKMVGRELQAQLVPSIRKEEAGHRFVIFPHAEPIASQALLKTFRLSRTLRPRYFSLDQAAQKAGEPRPKPGQYTYSIVLGGWVLPKETGYALVTPSSVSALPELRQMERIFHLVDTAAPEKITVELRAHSAATALGEIRYPIVRQVREVPISADVREKREYFYLFLAPEQLGRFLSDLRTLKLVLEVEYGEGGGSLVVRNR